MDNQWLKKLILDELSKLLLGHIPYSPSNEKFPAVVIFWVESFQTEIGMLNEEIDAPRILEAFRRAKPKLHQWPIPSVVIGYMKPRPHVQQIDHDPRNHEDNEGSDIGKMSKALCDYTEGVICKVEFDNIMAGFSVDNHKGAGRHLEKSVGCNE